MATQQRTQRSTNSGKMSSKAELAPSETTSLLMRPTEYHRPHAVEVLREHALQGLGALDSYVQQCVAEMAAKAKYANPHSVTLSEMQAAKVPGASSLYVYYCRLKKLVQQGNVEAVRTATSTTLAKSRSSGVHMLATPAELIRSLRRYQEADQLKASHYAELDAIVRARGR